LCGPAGRGGPTQGDNALAPWEGGYWFAVFQGARVRFGCPLGMESAANPAVLNFSLQPGRAIRPVDTAKREGMGKAAKADHGPRRAPTPRLRAGRCRGLRSGAGPADHDSDHNGGKEDQGKNRNKNHEPDSGEKAEELAQRLPDAGRDELPERSHAN